MSLTPEDDLIISICGIVAGSLSLLGSLSIIFMYSHQHIRKQTMFYQKLVLYLSISDLLWNLTTTINQVYYLVFRTYEYPQHEECIASGFIQQWFEVACDIWIATMSIYMYLRIVRKMQIEDKEYIFHLVSWGLPFIIAIIASIVWCRRWIWLYWCLVLGCKLRSPIVFFLCVCMDNIPYHFCFIWPYC